MKKLVLFLLILIFNFLPAFAAKKYYIKNDTDYNLQFLCFSKHNCYNITPTIIEIQNKEFVDNVLKVKQYFFWGKMYILSKQN